jgi:hypothetical protein
VLRIKLIVVKMLVYNVVTIPQRFRAAASAFAHPVSQSASKAPSSKAPVPTADDDDASD